MSPFFTRNPVSFGLQQGRYCTIYNAYHAVIATTLLITWPFAMEGAAGNQWVTVPVELTLGGTCRDYGNGNFCPGCTYDWLIFNLRRSFQM